jgi:hypothetical protein
MTGTVSGERFKITLALGEAWAANSQGDSKHFTRILQASGVGIPSAPLNAQESLTVATDVKTAALWCDRVWGSNPTIPKEVRFWGASPLETFTAISTITLPAARDRMAHHSFISDAALVEFSEFIGGGTERDNHVTVDAATEERMVEGVEGFLTNLITSVLARFDAELNAAAGDTKPSELCSLSGLFVDRSIQKFQQAAVLATTKRLVIPIYRERQQFEDEYKAGERSILTALIRDVALVDEDKLEWEQVLAFRADKESKWRFRRFVHWLDADYPGKSEQFIREAIELRLEDYEAALKKHGIRTLTGALGTVLDEKALVIAAIAAGAAATLAAGPLLIAAGAILPLAGKAALEIVTSRLDLDDVKRGPNSEVAFIHELKKLA